MPGLIQTLRAALGMMFLWLALATLVSADVVADRDNFRRFYEQRFPTVAPDDFVFGVYAIDQDLNRQWQAINEFPPYEFALDAGKALVEESFADGSTLIDCLGPDPVSRHPYFNDDTGKLVSLGSAVNECRRKHGKQNLSYQKQALQEIIAYLSFLERDKRRRMSAPSGEAALAAYERGKAYFYTKRGQLNLSCADCHMKAVGKRLREQPLMPVIGAVNHFPIYSLRAGALGSLHQRFVGCIEQVRGESPLLESRAFRELEYFLALMADGLPLMAPMTQR